MKILILILFPLFGLCQKKHDNTVMVHGVTFNDVIKTAVENGFHPSKIDTGYHFAEMPVGTGQTIYVNQTKSGDINITSDYIAAWLGNNQRFPVEYLTASYNQGRWNEMMKLAKLFPDITYAKN